jgi:hypothetical protein
LALAFALLVVEGVELLEGLEPEPCVTAGLELPLGLLEPGLGVLPVVVVPGRLPVVVVPPPLPPPTGVVDPPPPPDPPEGGGVVVVPPGVVVVPPGVVVVPPGRGGRGSVTVVTPGTATGTLLLRALTLAFLDFFDRLLQTAVFLDRFFFFLATTACESPLAELAAPEAANADAKPAVGVTSRASKQATARLYALGDIERAPFLRWGTRGAGRGLPPIPWLARRLERLSPLGVSPKQGNRLAGFPA